MIKDISNEEYHADKTSIGSTMLKRLDESPRVYEAEYITCESENTPTEALARGTAIHTSILEPDSFYDRYTVVPSHCSDRRTKAYKEWAASIDPGLIELKADELALIRRCTLAVLQNPLAARLVAMEGMIEKSIFWTDEATGLPCKFRFDKIAADVVIDIKSIDGCTDRKIDQSIEKYRYYLQEAHYLAGAEAEFGERDWKFYFIFVETSSPYRVRVRCLDPDYSLFGASRRNELLYEFAERSASKDWSEPNEHDLVSVPLPSWMKG